MKHLKICRVCEQFPPGAGGLAPGMFDLTNVQHDQGHKVTVITNSCSGDTEFDSRQPFDIIRIEAKRIFEFAWKAFDVISQVNIRPDIIHLHGPSSAVFIMRRSAGFPPLIQTLHAVRKYQLELFRDVPAMVRKLEERTGFPVVDAPPYMGMFSAGVIKDLLLERYICQRIDHLAVVAEYFAKQIKEYYKVPDDNITIVYNGSKFDSSAIKGVDDTDLNRFGICEKHKTILYTGRTDWVKRVHLLVEAMPIILRKFPDCRLVIAGDGDQSRDLQNLVQKLSLSEYVKLLGWLPHSDLPKLFKVANCFCLPSYWEGLSKSAIEAMSARVPVVASGNLSNNELLAFGKYGWLVDDATPEAWCKTIEGVLCGGMEVNKKVEDAASVVNLMYRWNLVAARMDTAYEKMISRHIGYIRS